MTDRIEFATQADGETIMALLEEMHEENGIEPLDVDKTAHRVARVIDEGVVLLLVREGEVIGTMGLFETSFWYTSAAHLTDQWTYVHPDYREPHHFSQLIAAARKVAAEAGLPFRPALVSPVRTEAKARLFRRRGFTMIGALFEDTQEAGSPCASADQKPRS